jgi:hypothetical protein
MPNRLSCDEAMRLSRARLRVQDSDLKQGKVEMLINQTAIGPVPSPWGIQGGFAVVYKFRTHSDKMRALRCFLAPMEPDIQFRYERIGTYFATHARNITVEFKYHNDGIVIKENVPGQTLDQGRTYPLVEMEWVEGMTLIDRIDELCRRRDRAALEDLINQWLAMLTTLRAANIAHCDLAGANVMVRPNGRLVLVDYDGVYIPDFAGRQPVVAGQADYQHPQMNSRPFNEEADNFSALVIYTALLALQVQPELWHKYTQQNAQSVVDKRLLFAQQDFIDPDRSVLMSELASMGDVRVKMALEELKQACRQVIAQVRFPFHIADPDFLKKQALVKLEQAVQLDDDEEIVNAWVPSLLDSYGPAQPYVARLGRARQTMQALKLFRDALQTHKIRQIVVAYNAILDTCKSVKKQERGILQVARSFIEAYNKDDDEALASVCDEIRLSNYGIFFAFTPQEAQRSALAQQRTAALTMFRQTLAGRRIQQIVVAYDAVLDGSPLVTAEERGLLREAQSFVQAYQSDDDQAIVAASEAIRHSAHAIRLTFTAQEQQRITLARQRMTALTQFRSVLTNKSVRQIAAAYNAVLDTSKSVTYKERNLVQVARDFAQAYNTDDDQAIVAASEVIQQLADYSQSLAFDTPEEQRILLAQQRKAALVKFRQALTSKRAEQIVAAYDVILTDCKNVTQEEREQLSLAHDLLEAYQDNNDRAITIVWDDIQSSRYRNSFDLTTEEQQRITLAKQRVTALEQFRQTVMVKSKDAEHIVFAYDPILDNCKNVTVEERALLQAARRFMDMHESVLAAIRADNDEQMASAYDEELVRQFTPFTPEQQERINKGLKRGKLEKALRGKDYGCAIRLAQEIEMESHKALTDDDRLAVALTLAKQKFIKQFDVKDVEAWLQGDEVVVRWRWPPDDLIRYAVILWRIDRLPRHPRKEEEGTGREWVFRVRNEQSCTTRFKIVRQAPIYLQVYLAMPDGARHPQTWFYSNGYAPSSRKVAS